MTVPPDLVFPQWGFLATGGTTTRATADRLDDIVNVKEFGAKGDGVTDDGTAIINAIAYAYTNSPSIPSNSNTKGGTLFFPAGTYFIANTHFPISLSSSDGKGSLVLKGAGRDATIIVGNYSTGIVDSIYQNAMFTKVWGGTLQSISDLTIWNQSTSATATCMIANGLQAAQLFQNIHFIASRGFIADEECYGEVFRNCIFTCGSPLLVNRADSATASPVANSVGLMHGQGTVENCRFEGFSVGLALANGATNDVGANTTSASVAFEISGNYFYRCAVGITGISTVSTDAIEGALIQGNQFERCNQAMYFNIVAQSFIAANRVGGIRNSLGGPCDIAPIATMNLSGGTVTVTTSVAHNIGSDVTIALVNINPSTFIPPGATWADGLGSGLVSIHVINTTSFSYTHSGAASGFVSGSWNYPTRSSIMIGSSQSCTYAANILDAPASNKSFEFSGLDLTGAVNTGLQTYNVVFSTQFPFGWNPPGFFAGGEGVGIPRMGWEFVMCDTTGVTNPNLFLDCRDLSAQFEGQVRYAIDVFNTKGFAAAVVAGDGFGSNVYKVRYNSSLGWLRVG